MYNPWVVRGQMRRIAQFLGRFIGLDYREYVRTLCEEVCKHPDWRHDYFVILIDNDSQSLIRKIEIREQEL